MVVIFAPTERLQMNTDELNMREAMTLLYGDIDGSIISYGHLCTKVPLVCSFPTRTEAQAGRVAIKDFDVRYLVPRHLILQDLRD